MVLFFVIVFIAELVLTVQLILLIRNWDRKVCALNDLITESQPVIENAFTTIRIAINKTLLNLTKIQIKINEKKDRYKVIILKHIITAILFIILHGRWKKIISVVELAFSANDVIKKVAKTFA